MTTVGDIYRRIEIRIAERTQEFMLGSWLDKDKPADWHGMSAAREQSHIEGLREALRVIDELQRDN